MKRKLIVIAVIVLTMALLFFVFRPYFIPQTIIKDGQEVMAVFYQQKDVSGDVGQIADIIKMYSAVKSFRDYTPYSQDAVCMEINMVVDHKPVHILLGDFDIWYESGNMGAYEIIDGDRLEKELNEMISRNVETAEE